MENTRFSQPVSLFPSRKEREEGQVVGYGALIMYYDLKVPLPSRLALITPKHQKYQLDEWLVFGRTYQPDETLAAHLTFALKYEGVNLVVLRHLFKKVPVETITGLVQAEVTGQYMRRLWFLYEWLMQIQLPIPDLPIKNYVPLLDDTLQYACQVSQNSARHRVRNNLPGTVDFCPLIYRTPKLDAFLAQAFDQQSIFEMGQLSEELLNRTVAFLLLKDSRASFSIEGETPASTRASRWGKAIGQAGTIPFNESGLVELQKIIIESNRFVSFGYRKKGGFVGEHDRTSGEPLPEHISARWEDLPSLMNGLYDAAKRMEENLYQPVFTAASIAFGFIYVHPFVDGNGRLHRFLIHHFLSKGGFAPPGFIFPVSAAILNLMEDYRKVLVSYSHPLLELIEWKKTADNNVEVLNDTLDYYRYFDATSHAEFLFECIAYTLAYTIPQEVDYLRRFDSMKHWLDDRFSMPDRTIALLIRFLDQNGGVLSKRALQNEFVDLTTDEVLEIEKLYQQLMQK